MKAEWRGTSAELFIPQTYQRQQTTPKQETQMEQSSFCSCRLGVIVRALGLGSRPRPQKRHWQLAGSAILFFFAFGFYLAITKNVDHHGILLLVVFSVLGIAVFLAALLSAIVGTFGCDDCVSRM
jgi:hypothetical protein